VGEPNRSADVLLDLLARKEALDGVFARVPKAVVLARVCHPDEVDRVRTERTKGLSRGLPFEIEARIIYKGVHRWQLLQYNPLKDESGQIIRWYVTSTDIDDRKRMEERLHNENLFLGKKSIALRCSRKSSVLRNPYASC
jgi:PAS fold